jgi:hypothetical protein
MSLALRWKEGQAIQEEQLGGTLGPFVPAEVYPLDNPQTDIPRIAKNRVLIQLIEEAVRRIPTSHQLNLGDARGMSELAPECVHLILTSPPYWTLKEYRDSAGQMGHIGDYDQFLAELDKVWAHCFRALVPGGRLICVVGDVCLSRRKQWAAHRCAVACLDSGALPHTWLRQPGSYHLAQDCKRRARGRERLQLPW